MRNLKITFEMIHIHCVDILDVYALIVFFFLFWFQNSNHLQAFRTTITLLVCSFILLRTQFINVALYVCTFRCHLRLFTFATKRMQFLLLLLLHLLLHCFAFVSQLTVRLNDAMNARNCHHECNNGNEMIYASNCTVDISLGNCSNGYHPHHFRL